MNSVLLSPSTLDQELALGLAQLGTRVWVWPLLNIDQPDDHSSLQETIGNLFGYDWLILKNSRAVDYFLRAFLDQHQPDELDEIRIAAIGGTTAEHLAKFHIHVDIALDHLPSPQISSDIVSYVGESNSL